MMIVLLVVLLVALIAFIVYWVTSSGSRTSGNTAISSSRTATPATSNDDEDEATKVRVAGPRLVRRMGGLNVGDEMPIGKGITIGRGQNCTIRLQDAEMSSVHAEFRIEMGRPVVVDLGSTNGTFVNGQQLPAHDLMPLKDNDEIKIGMTYLVYKDAD